MTELIWEGKYDKDGRRVAPVHVALPFQTIETVNESAQQRQRMLDLFSAGRDPDWRNLEQQPALLRAGLCGRDNRGSVLPGRNERPRGRGRGQQGSGGDVVVRECHAADERALAIPQSAAKGI